MKHLLNHENADYRLLDYLAEVDRLQAYADANEAWFAEFMPWWQEAENDPLND